MPLQWRLVALLLFVATKPTYGIYDFATACADLADGSTIKATYYRGTCYVGETTPAASRDVAHLKCKHMGIPGRLAYLQGNLIYDHVENAFINHFKSSNNNNAGWIGLRRRPDVTSSPTREQFSWVVDDVWYPAPPEMTRWYSSEPNLSGDITCGMFRYDEQGIGDTFCANDRHGTVCQYRSTHLLFKSVKRGVRGSANYTLTETQVANQLSCGRSCAALPLCQSFSSNRETGLCALHLLPAEEMSVESDHQNTLLFDIA